MDVQEPEESPLHAEVQQSCKGTSPLVALSGWWDAQQALQNLSFKAGRSHRSKRSGLKHRRLPRQLAARCSSRRFQVVSSQVSDFSAGAEAGDDCMSTYGYGKLLCIAVLDHAPLLQPP